MRLARNAGFEHTSRSYCSLSRTFWALSEPRDCAQDDPDAAINAAPATAIHNPRIVIPPCCRLNRSGSIDPGSIDHRKTAADAQYLPGDVIRAPSEKEHDRLGDLLRLGDAAERDSPGQRLAHAFRLGLEQRRVGRARADAVDVYLMARHLA